MSLLLVSLLLVSTGKGHMVIKRQAVVETNPDSFHLFGQIFGSLGKGDSIDIYVYDIGTLVLNQ